MKKTAFEEIGGTYRQEGNYLLPNLAAPESTPVGIWGQRRRRYLREHKMPFYTALLFSGKLDTHIADIDQQAEEMFSQLVKQMAEQEGITEQFTADHQLEWVGYMNNIRDRTTELINSELIYI